MEQKTIVKDYFPDCGVISSLNMLVVKPENVHENGTGQYSFQLPEEKRGKLDNITEPLREILKTANRQLRETKEYYGNSYNTGFVFISIEGTLALPLIVFAQILRNLRKKEFSSIDGIIINLPHTVTKDPVTGRITDICISITDEEDFNKKDKCMKLADKWVVFYEAGGYS